jgi:hypothetical protein
MNIFDNNVSLYFFSAVLQANTALIAFAAVFAVFRFQLLVQSLQNKDSEIIQLVDKYLARKPMETPEELRSHYAHIQTLEDAINALVADPGYQPSYRSWIVSLAKNQPLASLFLERRQLVDKQANLKKRFKWPMLSILFVILLALCVLRFSNYVHTAMSDLEFVPIIFTASLNIWALILNTKFVFTNIKN